MSYPHLFTLKSKRPRENKPLLPSGRSQPPSRETAAGPCTAASGKGARPLGSGKPEAAGRKNRKAESPYSSRMRQLPAAAGGEPHRRGPTRVPPPEGPGSQGPEGSPSQEGAGGISPSPARDKLLRNSRQSHRERFSSSVVKQLRNPYPGDGNPRKQQGQGPSLGKEGTAGRHRTRRRPFPRTAPRNRAQNSPRENPPALFPEREAPAVSHSPNTHPSFLPANRSCPIL